MYKNLKAEMLKQNVSIKTISQELKLREDTIYRKIKGLININISEAKKIKNLFKENNDLEYLFEE